MSAARGGRRGAPAAVACLALLGAWSPARAAVVAPPPGQQVVVLQEEALLVFDPLTGSQTTLVQHVFEGTSAPFGLLFATPRPAQVRLGSDRLRRAVGALLHPRANAQRTLDVELVSWIASCTVREVGDGQVAAEAEGRTPLAEGEVTALGAGPDPVHDWLLGQGFTLAPAQGAWLMRAHARGWSVVGVVVRPPVVPGPPPSRLRGPVVLLTHETDEPVFAAGHPPFALDGARGRAAPPLEIAVLTEWGVGVEGAPGASPFFADALSGRDVGRLAGDGGALPWAFRRDGTLTAFRIADDGRADPLRFTRAEAWPRTRPTAVAETRVQRLRVPVELVAVVLFAVVIAWRRQSYGRGSGRIALRR